jgi:NADPH:quinone reductase-like Zn-dependent oxidoreductase
VKRDAWPEVNHVLRFTFHAKPHEIQKTQIFLSAKSVQSVANLKEGNPMRAVVYQEYGPPDVLRKVDVRPGKKVLINGASGAIGSAAVQLAKHYGAEVTGVCGTPRLAFVCALGANHVIDYTQEDFTQNGRTYDLIFDILGKQSFAQRSSLRRAVIKRLSTGGFLWQKRPLPTATSKQATSRVTSSSPWRLPDWFRAGYPA